MVIGTCNWNKQYNGSFVSRNDALRMLDFFYENGGRIVDSAINYNSHEIIKEWMKKNHINDLKIITKIWKPTEISQCFDELGVDHIYCIMSRDIVNKNNFKWLADFKIIGMIDNIGTSIYYPSELIQNVNAFHIPASTLFIDYLNTMILHADIFVRSFLNLYNKKINDAVEVYKIFKSHERPDLNHFVYPVIGVSSLLQLKENMDLFK